jgi:hypothetical protein
MSADFSGKWATRLKSNPFLPGIENGMVAIRIDHIEPLMQLTLITSAIGYSFGNFVCNYRTDGAEVVTRLGSGQVRTNAGWESDELSIDMQIQLGSYAKRVQSRWSLSEDGRLLTMRHQAESGFYVSILHRQDPPEAPY